LTLLNNKYAKIEKLKNQTLAKKSPVNAIIFFFIMLCNMYIIISNIICIIFMKFMKLRGPSDSTPDSDDTLVILILIRSIKMN